jgi:UDP-glucose 4-epimerase
LIEEGHRVRVVDNFSTGRRENLAHLEGDPRLQVAEGDICDEDFLSRAMEGVHYVLHQAAIPSVPRSVKDPWSSHRANVEGTLKVLLAAREAGVTRVVFASSSSVYGDVEKEGAEGRAKKETLPPFPLSPYAGTKLAGEGYCRAFYRSYGLETVVLRYFNVFGPRQDPTSQYASVVPLFASALLRGGRPVIYGDGLQTRDFTHVENVVEGNLKACFAPGAAGRVFNLACGKSVSVLDLLQTMAKITRVKADPEFLPPRPGDVRHSRADISMARKVLGFKVRVGFSEGIRRTLATYGK